MPEQDFCDAVFTMEEEFIKLEQEIDPVESGFLEHMELH